MKRRGFLAVNIGVLALSAGLVLMTDTASAQDWDQSFSGTGRYTVLPAFFNQAVRDNNTGLVWEQDPTATTFGWSQAMGHCLRKNVGGTVGWRLPSIVELNSVRDPSLPPPYVPVTVFSSIHSNNSTPGANYWSATLVREDPYYLNFATGGIHIDPSRQPDRAVSHGGVAASFAWCVRGDMNTDQY